MNDYAKAKLKTLAGVLLFVLYAALVVAGQKTVGWGPLALMLLGLGGILGLLLVYNKRA